MLKPRSIQTGYSLPPFAVPRYLTELIVPGGCRSVYLAPFATGTFTPSLSHQTPELYMRICLLHLPIGGTYRVIDYLIGEFHANFHLQPQCCLLLNEMIHFYSLRPGKFLIAHVSVYGIKICIVFPFVVFFVHHSINYGQKVIHLPK